MNKGVTNKRGKSYKIDEIIKDICKCLINNENQTPSSLAKYLGVNPKTVQKYVEIARKLGILKCEDIEMGKNKIRICKINPEYKKIYEKLE